jgi:hypothetical protein
MEIGPNHADHSDAEKYGKSAKHVGELHFERAVTAELS